MIAISGFLTALECTKFVFGRGCTPNPAGGAYSASSDPLTGLRGLLLRGEKGRKEKGKGKAIGGREGVEGEEKGRKGREGERRKVKHPSIGSFLPIRSCCSSLLVPSIYIYWCYSVWQTKRRARQYVMHAQCSQIVSANSAPLDVFAASCW